MNPINLFPVRRRRWSVIVVFIVPRRIRKIISTDRWISRWLIIVHRHFAFSGNKTYPATSWRRRPHRAKPAGDVTGATGPVGGELKITRRLGRKLHGKSELGEHLKSVRSPRGRCWFIRVIQHARIWPDVWVINRRPVAVVIDCCMDHPSCARTSHCGTRN